MPCRDDGYPTQEQAPAWMLCEAMTLIESTPKLLSQCSPELQSWWKVHGTKEDERVRREAAAKLSPRERLALGIDTEGKARSKR